MTAILGSFVCILKHVLSLLGRGRVYAFQRILFPFLFLAVLLAAQPGISQIGTWAWVANSATLNDQTVTSVVYDSLNNVILAAGDFEGDLNLGSFTISSNGNRNGFVAQLTPFGQVNWLVPIYGTGDVHIADMKTTAFGEIFLTGDFRNNISFQTGSAPITLTSAGMRDAFLVRISPSGQSLGATRVGGLEEDFAKGLSFDGNRVYFCGAFAGTLNIGGLGTFVSSGGLDGFLIRVNPTLASFTWFRQFNSSGHDVATAVDSDGNDIVVAGTFNGPSLSLQGYAGPAPTNQGQQDIFLASYAQNGSNNWVNNIGSAGQDTVTAVASISSGIFLTGGFESTCTFFHSVTNVSRISNGASDIFLARYNPSTGNPDWVVSEGGANAEMASGIALDGQGRLFIAGTYSSNFVVGGVTPVNASGSNPDGLVAEYNQAGSFQSLALISGANLQMPNDIGAYAGEVAVGGKYNAASSFSFISPPYGGGDDAFVAVLGCPSPNSSSYSNVAGMDTSFCGDTLGLNAQIGPTWSGEWSILGGNAALEDSSDAQSNLYILAQGTTTLTWTLQNSSCTIQDTIVIVNSSPLVANAGSDTTFCGDSLQLYGNSVASPAFGEWAFSSGSGAIADSSDPNTNVTMLSSGPKFMVWKITNGLCTDSDTILIASDTLSATYAGEDTTFCGSSFLLEGSIPSSGSGAWSQIQGGGNIAVAGNPITTVNNLTDGVNVFVWNVANNFGCTGSDTIVLTADTVPSPAVAGADQDLCAAGSFQLGATPPAFGTGSWSSIPSGLVFSNPSLPNTTVSGLQTGANVLQWEVDNGSCPSNFDTLTLTVFDSIPANAGQDAGLCEAASTTLSGSDPSPGTGLWATTLGPGSANPAASPSATASGLGPGANEFVWTVTNGPCISTDTVQVFNDTIIPAQAGPDQVVCESDTVLLSANNPGSGIATWSILSGNASLSSSSDPNASVSSIALADLLLVWSIANGNCPASTDTLLIEVAPLTTADAGQDQSLCAATDATLAGSDPGADTGNWTVVNGSAFVNSPSDSASTVAALSLGVNLFAWSVSNGICPAASDTVSIEVFALVPAFAGQDQALCDELGSQLQASDPSPAVGAWSNPGGNAAFSNPNDPQASVSGLAIGSNLLLWQVVNGPCITADTVEIVVTPLLNPANAGPDQTLCDTSATMLMADSLPGFGLWIDLSGLQTFFDPTSPQTSVGNLLLGTNLLVWQETIGPCTSSDTVAIEVSPRPSAAEAGPDQEIGQDATTLAAAVPNAGSGTWSVLTGSGNFSDSNAANAEVSGIGIGENRFVWTVSSGACPSSSDTVLVRFLELVVPTGFSPNGDGKNDTWVIRGIQSYNAELTVFNRWGNQVYASSSYQNDWNGFSSQGTALSDDTYYYVLKLSDGRGLNGYVVIKR